jgi:hypothetical protein
MVKTLAFTGALTILAAVGVISCCAQIALLQNIFIAAATTVFSLLGVGGFISATRQGNVDRWEIYKEQIAMLKDKVNSLEEENIELKKQNAARTTDHLSNVSASSFDKLSEH